MSQFAYNARNATGKSVQGTLEAGSRREAVRKLSLQGLTPVSVSETAKSTKAGFTSRKKTDESKKQSSSRKAKTTETGKNPPARAFSFGGGSLKPSHRLPFLRALSDLIASGMPVGDAVRLLGTRFRDPVLKKIAHQIWEGVSSGLSVSDAMAQIPRVFDSSTVYLIQAGEATGSLREILKRLVVYLEERETLISRVKMALAYPAFIFILANLVLIFCVYFLFPRMESLLLSLGSDLPFLTQLLMDFSAFMVVYGIWVFAGLALIVLALWQWSRTPKGAAVKDRILVQLPVLGKFLQYSDVLAITQTFSALLENGITTIDALRMSENVISNRKIKERFEVVRPLVADGASISGAFAQTECFPDLVLDMIGVGENTGNIVPSLKEVSRQLEGHLSKQLRVFTGVVTSGVLIAAVTFVGIVAYAIFSAVLSLSAQFS
ncbi:MAG: type II secretion system F family protein [Opitutales bacterium]|nr:type II secretion system F family protein [Opitutales bacterium]